MACSIPIQEIIPTNAPASLGIKTNPFIFGKSVGTPVFSAVFCGAFNSRSTLISLGDTYSTVPTVRFLNSSKFIS
ncbi:MAG: hypothetical protein ACW98X_25825 [Promethearchaeota archaeon]